MLVIQEFPCPPRVAIWRRAWEEEKPSYKANSKHTWCLRRSHLGCALPKVFWISERRAKQLEPIPRKVGRNGNSPAKPFRALGERCTLFQPVGEGQILPTGHLSLEPREAWKPREAWGADDGLVCPLFDHKVSPPQQGCLFRRAENQSCSFQGRGGRWCWLRDSVPFHPKPGAKGHTGLE